MAGLGMIFDETYRPFFEAVHRRPLYAPDSASARSNWPPLPAAPAAGPKPIAHRPGDRIAPVSEVFASRRQRFEADLLGRLRRRFCLRGHARQSALRRRPRRCSSAGKHLLVEKPSVLTLAELDDLDRLARQKQVLAKVVYHKLLDPDHKKLRTLVVDDDLQHVNNGYCSLLEPKSIAGGQFAEWIHGRNPGTYVAVHYIKLIDFTFGGRLRACTAPASAASSARPTARPGIRRNCG